MPELFDPARHEPLGGAAWSADQARLAIEAIVAEVRAEAGADGTWTIHSRDEAPAGTPPGRGLAAYLADCIAGRCRFPSLEFETFQ